MHGVREDVLCGCFILSNYLSIYLSIYLSVHPYIRMETGGGSFLYSFKGLRRLNTIYYYRLLMRTLPPGGV